MKFPKMLVVALAAGTLAFGATSVATSAPASAHTPEASATCESLSVALTNYSVDRTGAEANTLIVEIDDEVVEEVEFGASLHEEFPLGDTEVAHEYVVTVDAIGTQYDRDFAGSSVPCQRAVTPDAQADVSVTPPTCDTGATLVLGEATNATWGTPTAVEGPAPYSVTATADADHQFYDGTAERTFTGTLDGPLAGDACAPPVVVPDRPAPTVDVTDDTTVDCTALTQTVTTTTTTTDVVLDVPTNTWVAAQPVVVTTTAVTPVDQADCTPSSFVTPPTTPNTPVTPTVVTPPAPITPSDSSQTPVSSRTADGTLASTGSNADAIAPIGAALLLAGAALMLARRFVLRRAADRD